MGNPFCQEDEYRRYVLAHLKNLKYLDYRLVDQQATAQAKEQYQDELLDLEESESQHEEQEGQAEEKAKRVALHRAANMKGMDEVRNVPSPFWDSGLFGRKNRSLLLALPWSPAQLMDDIMVKGDGDMAKLRGQQQFQDPINQLAEQVWRHCYLLSLSVPATHLAFLHISSPRL